MNHVFVYGTLLAGESNNYLLKTSERLGEETVSGFTMVNLGAFPALIVDDNSTTQVVGEVWEVTDETLQRLDWLEGYPRFYNRREVDTFAGKAWVYFMPEEKLDNMEVITSGSWKKFRRGEK